MSTRYILLLSLTVLFLFFTFSAALSKSQNDFTTDDDEELSFLEEADIDTNTAGRPHHFDDDFADDFDKENYCHFDESQCKEPEIDYKDVAVLENGNFSDFIENHKFVMVEFYAPCCGHCQALVLEYAAAATELKATNKDVILAKVDATEENDLWLMSMMFRLSDSLFSLCSKNILK